VGRRGGGGVGRRGFLIAKCAIRKTPTWYIYCYRRAVIFFTPPPHI